jgi:DNA polymerase
MLASIGLYRNKNCFIANVVKCRPPNNRNPLPEEIAACASFLNRQIALLAPRAILCVGRVSTGALLHTAEGIGKLRGSFAEYRDITGRAIPLLPTYHPSALLRDESLKRPAWEDLKRFMTKLSELDEAYAGGETKFRSSP